MRDIVLDFAQAYRLCTRHPTFAAFAVATLAVGIGAATLVFSLVHAALLRDLPFEHPDRLVWMYNARTERDRAPLSIPDLEDYRHDARTLADLAVFTNWAANLTGVGTPERLEGTRVSGNFFGLLGARPLLGRTLSPHDESGDGRVVVLTYGLWNRRFGASASLVGQTITLNGANHMVVGVLPPGFMFPFRDAELAVPTLLRSDPRRADRGANFLRVVARLAPRVTLSQARAELDGIAHRLQRTYPDADSRKTGISLYPLHREIVRDYRQILWTLLAAVAVLLTVGCGNLANVLLARAIGRRSEFVLRACLGASRGRIVRQLVVESLVLAAAGGAAGVGLATVGLAAWRTCGPANFPRMSEVALDGVVLAFALSIACLTALVCAVIPARSVDRGLVAGGASRSTTGDRQQHIARRTFLVVQIAGAVVLLVTMGLVTRGFARLERVSPGFAPDHALSLQLSLPPRVYTDRAAIRAFYERLRDRLTSIPEIGRAGAVSLRPLTGLLSAMDVAFPDRPAPPPDEVPQAHFRIASPGYFAAAGIPLAAGREFTDRDLEHNTPVAVVSRTFAERHWPGEAAVGKLVQIVQAGPSPSMEVVGVVNDVKQFALDGPATADLYVPLAQMPASQVPFVAARMYWLLRTSGDPHLLATRVRQAVQAVDADVATSSMQTLDEVVASSVGASRVNVRLLQAFSVVAMGLCAVGVYAVTAFSAGARRRELAIRVAVGATRRELVALLLGDQLRSVVVGLGLGYAVALVVAPNLEALLFTASPWDLPTYALMGLGLLLVTGVASYLPARRAGRTDPVDLLRN